MLLGSAALIGGVAVGCDKQSEPEPSGSTSVRSDVPLRVLLVGSEEDASAITRGWGAVTEHPLTVETIAATRDNAESLAESVMASSLSHDVLIYPLMLVAELDATDSITAMADEEFQQAQAEAGDLYAALRNSAARYSGKYIGMPLGAPLPAMIAGEELPSSREDGGEDTLSWEDYDRIVQQRWQGSAAEPSAPGWAGAMYLWRTASNTSWLFHRESFEPLITGDGYVDALALMKTTHDRYEAKLQTPSEVWNAVAAGKLRGGIGFPLARNQNDGEPLLIRNIPGVDEISRVLLDPFSRVVSLSVNCRQSTVAKRFMHWISGGEGSVAVRNQIAGMTNIRNRISQGDGESSSNVVHYDQWLAGRLSAPVSLPTLQIRQGGFYYRTLDEQIVRVLRGEADAATALAEVASQWQAKTKEIGADKQLRAWRRAQGMRG